ncbi:MAG: hypothetical protein ACK5VA_05665 [Pseudanabaena sp.]|jgi:hypothetical protein|uniref:hypothetical protein n=1 Tax=Bacteria TaxID=2 RepID=UPI0022C1D89F|nr:hypothetical protein [Microcystis sp. LE19-41.2A]MCZ8050211.1 hypothetical protein [Microcystis sp. LE19-41.2A]MCZ8283587.1 hypothetical protein [Aquidulcibacter sp.]NCR83009.1 hypothetical protein [Microcystis aeruginosa K13-10]NCR87702.1 hypothetical protein [Microcystis aeruginosa K13-05]
MTLKSTRGGRGHVAPYETTHARIPIAIKPYVNFISDSFKQSVEDGTDDNFVLVLESTMENITMNKGVNENNIRQLALEVVKLKKQKKSTKIAFDNLLTAILGEDYEP